MTEKDDRRKIEKSGSPHDAFFCKMMSDQRVAKDFMLQYLPKRILEKVDLNTLKKIDSHFINKNLQRQTSDVLFSVFFGGSPGYIYVLVEHQSTPQKLMPFRIVSYQVEIIKKHLKRFRGDVLPVVYPIVFYNGEKPYSYSNDIFDLFGANKALAQQVMFQPFHLVDLTKIEDNDLRAHVWSGVMGLLMKHIRADDITEVIKVMLNELKRVIEQDPDGQTFDIIMSYIFLRGRVKDIEQLKKVIVQKLPTGEPAMKTIAEQIIDSYKDDYIREGMQRGMQQGVSKRNIEIVKNLLKEKASHHFIAKVTGLSVLEVKAVAGELEAV